ncbi:MAG: hypothetical protein Q7S28_04380 [bacterium]|nr:hypothetical protein [bacterium]
MKRPEQICPGEGPGYRKHLKRLRARTERRVSKKDIDKNPEEVPSKSRRAYRGYSI